MGKTMKTLSDYKRGCEASSGWYPGDAVKDFIKQLKEKIETKLYGSSLSDEEFFMISKEIDKLAGPKLI